LEPHLWLKFDHLDGTQFIVQRDNNTTTINNDNNNNNSSSISSTSTSTSRSGSNYSSSRGIEELD
jgi:hypothetical protein